jgi:hypothetical protein
LFGYEQKKDTPKKNTDAVLDANKEIRLCANSGKTKQALYVHVLAQTGQNNAYKDS